MLWLDLIYNYGIDKFLFFDIFRLKLLKKRQKQQKATTEGIIKTKKCSHVARVN